MHGSLVYLAHPLKISFLTFLPVSVLYCDHPIQSCDYICPVP